MIIIKSNTLPNKFVRIISNVNRALSEIRQISNHDIRMYCDASTGIVLDANINKILWEDDLTFSMAIVTCRLRALKEFWCYEKSINSINNSDDFESYLKLKKKFYG